MVSSAPRNPGTTICNNGRSFDLTVREVRTPRAPQFREVGELLWRGSLPQVVRPFNRAKEPHIVDGQHVWPIEPEDEDHLGRPTPDPPKP